MFLKAKTPVLKGKRQRVHIVLLSRKAILTKPEERVTKNGRIFPLNISSAMTFSKSLLVAAACIAGADAFAPASSLPALRTARASSCLPVKMSDEGESEMMTRREVCHLNLPLDQHTHRPHGSVRSTRPVLCSLAWSKRICIELMPRRRSYPVWNPALRLRLCVPLCVPRKSKPP